MDQIIGRTDLSGVTTGPHLHFAVSPGNLMNVGTRINPIGNYIPFSYEYESMSIHYFINWEYIFGISNEIQISIFSRIT
ncbi:MAG: hypothetical protein QXU40_03635 [Candidatus Pacearchaeota archaeon]